MQQQIIRMSIRVELQVSDSEGRYFGSPLTMNNDSRLEMMDFAEMAEILHQFYQLSNQIKETRGK